MMKRLETGATILALVLCAGTVSAGTPQTKTVADIYLDKCAVCHGSDGAGKTAKGRKLKVKDVRETSVKLTAAQMIDVVTKGKDPDMDAFGGGGGGPSKELGADMIKQIVDFYRGLAKK